MTQVGFIGFGRMGAALAKGAVRSGALKKNHVRVFNPSKKSDIRKAGFKAAVSIAEIVSTCTIVFLCVKPQKMESVLTDVRNALDIQKKKDLCFVSIAAGTPLARIRQYLGHGVSLFRVMPNTPALLGSGMSALSRGPNATAAQERVISAVLKGVGEMVVVSEKWMDAVTALSGSGPAYVFYLAEGMIQAAQSVGMKKDLARVLVHQTLFGAGRMLKERTEDARELRRQVTSPGGTTAAAIAEFEKRKFLESVVSAVRKATKRSKELARI